MFQRRKEYSKLTNNKLEVDMPSSNNKEESSNKVTNNNNNLDSPEP